MFLLGTAKRQPYEMRKQVDGFVRNFSNYSLKYHHRFQLNTLTGRYNTLCELWSKQIRAMEEGRPIPGIGAGQHTRASANRAPRPADRAEASPAESPDQMASERRDAAAETSEADLVEGDGHRSEDAEPEKVLFAITISDPESASESETIKVLYEHYLQARHSEGGRPQIKLESFVKQVAKQAATLKASSGSQSLEFRVLRTGDSVTLKARKGKQES